ncbi:MAG: hypothetical protein HC831_18145 [Chloroflexia bacterium]|nr:hypothetical protein [Chloroflexia bacterium]
MTIVTQEIDKINNLMNIKEFEKLIPCDCQECINNETPHQFDYYELMERLENNRNDIECKNLLIIK